MKIFHRARGPLCLVLTLLLLVQAGGPTVSAADPEDGLTPSVPDPAAYTGGEILVLYQDGSCETVACQDNAALAETLAQLSARPDVALVQPNYTYESTALSTSDPLAVDRPLVDVVRRQLHRRQHPGAGGPRHRHRPGGRLAPV